MSISLLHQYLSLLDLSGTGCDQRNKDSSAQDALEHRPSGLPDNRCLDVYCIVLTALYCTYW